MDAGEIYAQEAHDELHKLRARAFEAERKLHAAREALEQIVCTEGEDRGVVLLDQHAPTRYDDDLKCQVYLHENFSPLGDALIALWREIQPD